MPQTNIRIATELISQAEKAKPTWKSTPRFIEDLLEQALFGLDMPGTIGPASAGPSTREIKEINKVVVFYKDSSYDELIN